MEQPKVYDLEELKPFIRYRTSRSSGSGGQHVNKVSSKVELLFDVNSCDLFSEVEKNRLREKLNGRFNTDYVLQISSQESRSQIQNKERAQQKLIALINGALKIPKPRKATKKSKASIEKRLDTKKKRALIKMNRKGIKLN